MVKNRQPAVSVSEHHIATLDTFAEKTLQAPQLSEVMMAEPTVVQRGAIYLITAALGFSFCLLYFGKVSAWISTKGTIIAQTESIPGQASLGRVIAIDQSHTTPLVVKATVPNKDIGFVKQGMSARIKVDAYPFQQFGTIPARVQQIFPNVNNSENFTITLELVRDTIKADGHEIQLFQGLTVQAEVQTREQRLFELLFSKE